MVPLNGTPGVRYWHRQYPFRWAQKKTPKRSRSILKRSTHCKAECRVGPPTAKCTNFSCRHLRAESSPDHQYSSRTLSPQLDQHGHGQIVTSDQHTGQIQAQPLPHTHQIQPHNMSMSRPNHINQGDNTNGQYSCYYGNVTINNNYYYKY